MANDPDAQRPDGFLPVGVSKSHQPGRNLVSHVPSQLKYITFCTSYDPVSGVEKSWNDMRYATAAITNPAHYFSTSSSKYKNHAGKIHDQRFSYLIGNRFASLLTILFTKVGWKMIWLEIRRNFAFV
jgi:hypothetical protein